MIYLIVLTFNWEPDALIKLKQLLKVNYMHLKIFWKKTEKKPNLEKKNSFFSTIKNIVWKKTVFFQTL